MRVLRASVSFLAATFAAFAALIGQSQPTIAQDYGERPAWQYDRPWWMGPRPIRRPPSRYDRYSDPDEDYDRPRRRWRYENDQDYGDQGGDLQDEQQQDQRPRRRVEPDRRTVPADRNDDNDSGNGFDDANSNKPAGVDGGARPYIAPQTPPVVAFGGGAYPPGSIVIDTNSRKLYYVTRPGAAYAYPIGVGREGFSWTGSEKVSRIQDWPDWYPPAEMRVRKPELPERMLGGLNNPLGAKAIYLGNTLYRIHGTNDPKSIGHAESSGCFRMLNAHVLHLASLVQVGTQVTVVRSLSSGVVASSAPAERPRITEKAPQRRWSEQRPSPRYRTNPWWEYDPPDNFR